MVGTAVVVTAALVVVGLQFKHGGNRREQALDVAFGELARADLMSGEPRKEHLAKAQVAFAKAAAVVSLEPQALIGVALTDVAAARWGEPVHLPCQPTQCDEAQVIAHCKTLLEHGKPAEAVRFAQSPDMGARRAALRQLEGFAVRWMAAGKGIPGLQ